VIYRFVVNKNESHVVVIFIKNDIKSVDHIRTRSGGSISVSPNRRQFPDELAKTIVTVSTTLSNFVSDSLL
jgi:hypothetical protein